MKARTEETCLDLDRKHQAAEGRHDRDDDWYGYQQRPVFSQQVETSVMESVEVQNEREGKTGKTPRCT